MMVDFKDIIADAIYSEELGLTKEEIKNMIEIPADEKMGDYAFPCFRLAKALRKAPQLIAADIAAKAGTAEAFAKVENVNAYVNFFIDRAFFAGEVIDVDAYTGGYNLQIAFATGACAGKSAAAYATEKEEEL
jgi:arginyl-tRNA synthetase